MLRFLSPILILAFYRANKPALKKLGRCALAYGLMLCIFLDFEEVIIKSALKNNFLTFKLIKWCVVLVMVGHFSLILKQFHRVKSTRRSNTRIVSTKHLNDQNLNNPSLDTKNTAPITRLTKAQKIILKYRKVNNEL
jgi:hypothetical protein